MNSASGTQNLLKQVKFCQGNGSNNASACCVSQVLFGYSHLWPSFGIGSHDCKYAITLRLGNEGEGKAV